MGALLRTTAGGLRKLAETETLVEKLSVQMLFTMGNAAGKSEKKSWQESYPAIAEVLINSGLENVECLLEYQLPYTSKRIDLVICGTHPTKKVPTIIAIELKQWTDASSVEDDFDIVKIGAYGNHPVLHPIKQVSNYCAYLTDFNRFLENSEAKLYGVAYLHNWLNPRNSVLDQLPPSEHGILFTCSEVGAFQNYLKANISSDNSAEIADSLLASKLSPTKQLMDAVAAEIQHQSQFVLLDEQQLAYSLVMKAVRDAQRANSKTAIVITGGPGTGKSVIALALLGELSRQGKSALHATGSRAFRNSLRKIAGKRNPRVQKMFSYFNSFMSTEINSLDVLICDEAHRVRATSANRYTKADLRTGVPQIHELLNAARVPVFLLDSHQVVRKGELGTPEYIIEEAENLGIKVERVDLDGQFRNGGSRLYETWIESALELDGKEPLLWDGDDNFELLTVNSPSEMENFLRKKNSQGFKSRITAGYCWTWHDPNPDDTLPLDVQIGDWKKPWNVKGDRGVGEYMSGELWAIDPNAFDQVGCVYTAQGFEYEWNGVIFGPDLVWRSGEWVGDVSKSKDPIMKGLSNEVFTELVKNTYKVLLTRGLKGTLLYSVDAETQLHFNQLL